MTAVDVAALDANLLVSIVACDFHVVDPTGVDVPEAINAKDRHVVAAALAAEATLLVTRTPRSGA